MALIRVKRGHDLRLSGRPEPAVSDAPRPKRVAVHPPDFRYLRPRLKVREGDDVLTGTTLFESKDDPRIRFVSPGAGKVARIRYGERRKLLEVVVELGREAGFVEAGVMSPERIRRLPRARLIRRMLQLGLWPLIRRRPYSKIADPDGRPKALFVSAMAGGPFDVDPNALLRGQEDDFQLGLDILREFTHGDLHLCIAEDAQAQALTAARDVRLHRFAGPYPTGEAAVQIYHVSPPRSRETVWYVRAQDVLTIARSLRSGRFEAERIVSVCGPGIEPGDRRYYRSSIGASVDSLVDGKVAVGRLRYVSGGVLRGRNAGREGFTGFYDTSLVVLREGGPRELLGFMRPGSDKYSASRAWLSSFLPKRDFDLDTRLQGSVRNFVLNGIYEDVCPVDLLPQHLAKSVLAGDIEESEKHGILDCVGCGLCSFVCPSKIEVAGIIQRGIDEIFRED